MFDILEGDTAPVYMDQISLNLLKEARNSYDRLGFATTSVIETGVGSYILAMRCGTVKTTTLALALGAVGFQVTQHDGFLKIDSDKEEQPLRQVLHDISSDKSVDLFAHSPNLVFEKFHSHLTPDLLQQDALSTRLDLTSLRQTCELLL